MNVGGHRLTNQDLRSHFATLGFLEVATFRASGNVTFAGEAAAPEDVRARIEEGLERLLGYAVPTFIRDADEVLRIAAKEPFTPEQLRASKGKLQVAMMLEQPSGQARKALMALESEGDRLLLAGRELYWLPGGGILESELDMKGIQRLLGPMTIRTKGTVEQIAAKHFA
jgi:uncharacterized protein (DUF1697 family)